MQLFQYEKEANPNVLMGSEHLHKKEQHHLN